MKYTGLLLLGLLSLSSFAQKYTAEKTFVSFYSAAPLEDITAENTKTTTIFNTTTGDIAFSVPMKEFRFAKSLMREHFNEKYVESEKFPKATFQGKVVDFKPGSAGVQQVKAQGKLTIHGVTKDVDVPGTIEVKGNKLEVKSKFMVKVADYNIEIPQLVLNNIAEQVEVRINFVYKPM
jgi:polyisoprenoid-binding protein YceI